MKLPPKKNHPEGEKNQQLIVQGTNRIPVDTYGGRVYIDWDHDTPVTPLGQLSFFIEFLKRTELFDSWVETCPLKLTSPNAPKIRDVLGTILLSVLSGHTRYSHITTVRTDKVNAPLLGMNKIVSEDSVRRALIKIPEAESIKWLTMELRNCYSEILTVPWILDVDTTIKSLYGHQEGALAGYNPHKPGRPSHIYHTYMIANIRMIVDVEVTPGNESASSYTLPYLFSWLDLIPREHYPEFIRADCSFGTHPAVPTNLKQTLSERQLECLNLLMRGYTNKQIAKILLLSPRTVEHYIDQIKAKFSCKTRTELITKVFMQGPACSNI